MSMTIAQDTGTRANQSGFGTASDGETWSHPIGAGTLSISSNELSCTNAGTGSDNMLLGGGKIINGDLFVRFSMTTPASDNAGFTVRYVDSSNYVRVQINTGHITIRTVVAGVGTNLTPTTGITISASTYYRAHINLNNNVYSVNVWLDGTSEPGGWVCQTTDAGNNFVKPTQYGLFATIGVAADIVNHDSFLVTSTPPTIYISSTGNDSTGDGSSGNPYLTVVKADANIGSGSIVNVLPGTYTYAATANTLTNGTPLARVVWLCNGLPASVFLGGSIKFVGSMNNSELWIVKGNYNDVFGFDLNGGTLAKIGISNWGHHNRYFHNFAHDIATGLAIGSVGAGFFSYAGITTNGTSEWAYNVALRCGQGGVGSFECHGFYMGTTADNIHDNIASNCAGWGYNISGSGFSAGNSMNIYHNLAFHNVYGGFVCQLSADFNVFKNNITYNNNVVGSGIAGNGFTEQNTPGTHNVYDSNCSFLQGGVNYLNVVETITNPINADPQFINYQADGSGDYHLKTTSPCKDAGVTNAISTIDFDGNPRPLNTLYDIGPYEYGYLPNMADGEVIWDMDRADAGGGVWRYFDSSNFYQAVVNDVSSSSGSTNLLTIYRTVGGVRTSVASGAIAFTRGMYKRFKVIMVGGVITAFMDGVQVCTYTDSAPLSTGKTGLVSESGSNNRFYQFRQQAYGDVVSSHTIQTRLRLASTNPAATPQVPDLSLAAFGNTIQAGVNIPQTKFFHKYNDQNINELAKASNFWAYFDKNKVAYFLARDGIPAPWIASSTPSWVDSTGTLQATFLDQNITVEDSSDLYRNRQIIDNVLASTTINENRKGDGVSTSWTFGNQWAGVPTITVNNVIASVGVKNVDSGKQFYYAVGDPTITEDGSGPVYDNSFTINFQGPGQYLTYSQADNTTEQTALAAIEGTSGIVVNVEDGTGLTKVQGDALAQDRLNQYSKRGRLLKATTRRSGLAPGQLLPVFLPEHNINDGLFLVRQVITHLSTEFGVQQGIYTIEAISGADLGDWIKLYQRT